MALPLTIGTLDIKDWVDEDLGYEIGYVDREGPNTKVMLSGDRIVDLLARKVRISVTLIPLNHNQLQSLVEAISPAYVSVTYFDLQTATSRTSTFIVEPLSSAKYVIDSSTGIHWFKGISLTLTEK